MTTTEHEHLDAVRDRLATLFPDLPRSVIDETIAAQYARFEGTTIRDFVPLFVERKARAALQAQERPSHDKSGITTEHP
ncbi:MAG: hypothetical protein U5O16_24140 [Rhodococcus sp. (in: high G+C Gram-positive bacteria)]|uniref:three-helix bundle dimerization domain-containing protein n=1 Tax=Rhodococcus sp. TaxID=1831 RepID=UPI002AD72155|nr:hypothetical protein [Rhodococcus sp. (in: high G+C Gram-positive bacteria)]